MAIKKKKKAVKKKVVAKKKKVTRKKIVKTKKAKVKNKSSKPSTVADFDNLTDKSFVYVNGKGKPANGRPSKEINLKQLRYAAQVGCTEGEMAGLINIDKSTFTDLKKNNPIVKMILDAGRAEGKTSLRKKQHTVALNGDTSMLKWLGKNRLKQADRSIAHLETSVGETFKEALEEGDEDSEDEE